VNLTSVDGATRGTAIPLGDYRRLVKSGALQIDDASASATEDVASDD